MTDEELAIQLPKLKTKIPYDEDIFGNTTSWESCLKDLLEDSKFIALEVLFPYEDWEC